MKNNTIPLTLLRAFCEFEKSKIPVSIKDLDEEDGRINLAKNLIYDQILHFASKCDDANSVFMENYSIEQYTIADLRCPHCNHIEGYNPKDLPEIQERCEKWDMVESFCPKCRSRFYLYTTKQNVFIVAQDKHELYRIISTYKYQLNKRNT